MPGDLVDDPARDPADRAARDPADGAMNATGDGATGDPADRATGRTAVTTPGRAPHEDLLWSIGGQEGRSPDLVDNYKTPDAPGDVVWRVPADGAQRWPLYHPSNADPLAGYRARPYRIEFGLDHAPSGHYVLRLGYATIAARLPYLQVTVNGTSGVAFLRPSPSTTGEIRLQAGLHSTIYAEGVAEVVVPSALLQGGDNAIELTCLDDGEILPVTNPDAVMRLDRMANGAGIVYGHLAFTRSPATPTAGLRRVELAPSVVYVRTEAGELRERCDLYLELAGPIDATELILVVREGAREERHAVRVPDTAFGHVHVQIELFDGDGPVAYHLAGDVAGTRVSSRGEVRRRRKWKVYVAAHAHTDIGYTHRQVEVAERLCRNIDVALGWLERDRDAFAYHLDATWALETYLDTRGERAQARLVDEIRAGGVGVVANHMDLLTQFAALEDLIRNHEWSDSFLRPHGLEAELAAVVDVASLTGSLPALLAGSGVKYLVHANNQDRGPFRLNGGLHRRSPFYWEGAAGGRVLCWLAKMYCELRKVCGSPPTASSAARGLGLWLDEYDHDGYAPDAVMLYGQEADNTDLDPQPIAFVRSWNAEHAYPQLIPADPAAFFRYVETNFAGDLATVRGDGGAYWEDGVGSSLAPTMQARDAQATLPAAERLAALAVVHGRDLAYPSAPMDAAWRELLMYDEHTWGAFLSGTDPDALLARDQWAVKEASAQAAQLAATQLLHGAATRHSLGWNNEGREVVVYNTHSWPVSGCATVEIGAGEALQDLRGRLVPTREVRRTETQKTVELWMEALPGLSYRRFRLTSHAGGGVVGAAGDELRATGAEPMLLENAFYRLTLDPRRGCVTSLFDKDLQRELVDAGAPWGMGQVLHASGGEGTRLVSNQADLPDGAPEVTADFALQRIIRAQFTDGERVTLAGHTRWGELEATWTLRDSAKAIELEVVCRKEATREKEALYVAFPLDLPDARVLSDSQLGWVDWARDSLPGACKEWLPLQTGVRIEGAGAHAFLASPDIPLFCVGDIVRGRWPRELSLSGGRIYSYVLNNYWNTNYRASQGGEIRFRYAFTSAPVIAPDAAYRLGWESRRPLYAQRMSYQAFRDVSPPYAGASGGTLAEAGSEHVVLSTLKGARRADGLIARLQEVSGRDGHATVSFPGRRIERAWETNLLEHDLRELPVTTGGDVRVRVPAFGLATVRLAFAEDAPR